MTRIPGAETCISLKQTSRGTKINNQCTVFNHTLDIICGIFRGTKVENILLNMIH